VSGKLHLSKPFSGTLNCATPLSTVWWWITLDGAVVRSSFTLTPSGTTNISQTLVGVTASAVAAGAHTMDVNAMCATGTWTSASWITFSQGTAIVVG
jgi:hypothetical protein